VWNSQLVVESLLSTLLDPELLADPLVFLPGVKKYINTNPIRTAN
jgi:hypothetical protein